MHLNEQYLCMNGEEIWDIIGHYINENRSFNSVTNIRYQADVRSDHIFYQGGSGIRGESGETIKRNDFINGYETIRLMENINTNTIKNRISNSLYQKRSPFIGILFSAGIISQ